MLYIKIIAIPWLVLSSRSVAIGPTDLDVHPEHLPYMLSHEAGHSNQTAVSMGFSSYAGHGQKRCLYTPFPILLYSIVGAMRMTAIRVTVIRSLSVRVLTPLGHRLNRIRSKRSTTKEILAM